MSYNEKCVESDRETPEEDGVSGLVVRENSPMYLKSIYYAPNIRDGSLSLTMGKLGSHEGALSHSWMDEKWSRIEVSGICASVYRC